MQRIAGIIILLSLLLMAVFPVVTLAADPPDMEIEIIAISPGDLTVYVNGGQLANMTDLAGLKGLMTGSGADLWTYDAVRKMWKQYVPFNEARIELLMDSQAKSILVDQMQQDELGHLDYRLQTTDDTIWATKSQINQNEASIQCQQESLEQTDALLLSVVEGSDKTAQWLEVNNEYWNSRVVTLEARINELQEQNENNDLMVYGGYGLAACFLAVFVVGAKKSRG